MKLKLAFLATAAALWMLPASAQHQHSGTPSGGSDAGAPSSGQSMGGGHMMGGESGSRMGGHMMGGGAGDGGGMPMDPSQIFSRMDSNKDGFISREEWDAMHQGASGSSQPATPSGSSK